MIAKLATWAAAALIEFALKRVFKGAAKTFYRELDHRMAAALLRSDPDSAIAAAREAAELALGHELTPLEQKLFRLGYDPIRAASPFTSKF